MTVSLVAFGGGVNSTAMLCGMVERGETYHAALFSDTGGERPETYRHVETFSAWLVERGRPPILTLRRTRRDGSWESLEEECLRIEALPSLAYGHKKCSQKFKREPQEKWANHDPACRAAWKAGERVVKLIGFDADEEHRALRSTESEDGKYVHRYPLIEWDWGREECIEAIRKAGAPMPGKSSCFYCPASTKKDILSLPCNLLARALAMEEKAKPSLGSVKGLGRRFAWGDFIKRADGGDMYEPPTIACGCYDGDAS